MKKPRIEATLPFFARSAGDRPVVVSEDELARVVGARAVEKATKAQ